MEEYIKQGQELTFQLPTGVFVFKLNLDTKKVFKYEPMGENTLTLLFEPGCLYCKARTMKSANRKFGKMITNLVTVIKTDN